MSIKVVLFDLDGTLLPMDQDLFAKTYLGLLAKKLVPFGYEPESLIAAIWAGTKEMVKNDGSAANEQVFWKKFCSVFGEEARKDEPIFAEFYANEFSQVQSVCGYTEDAARVVRLVKEKGLRVALATNPLFPAVATESRIRWAGLEPKEFEFFTSYEESRFCKPHTGYYKEVLDRLGVGAEECLMVGNDALEDTAAEKLGMQVFLLTDCLINKSGEDISAYQSGNFKHLIRYIKELQ